ncbi:10269_t:CDS:2 [Paraglomus occultum]|uniref:10269_t:CDS:1 n=1 Tax=Paraglomus occultum TaxID=144539 RepID=A0A9N9FMR4_9GLOM|nr:10269_t:CDS:2 [Paraglomus occultum]
MRLQGSNYHYWHDIIAMFWLNLIADIPLMVSSFCVFAAGTEFDYKGNVKTTAGEFLKSDLCAQARFLW